MRRRTGKVTADVYAHIEQGAFGQALGVLRRGVCSPAVCSKRCPPGRRQRTLSAPLPCVERTCQPGDPVAYGLLRIP